MKVKANIIGIGAQKCASTWVYGMLAEHPDVAVSEEKEVNFFSYYYDRGYHWYHQQFSDDNQKHLAEVSPSYFCDPAVPARVARYNPDAKIVLTLRDPLQRALSNHKHEVRMGHADASDLSLEAGLENNPMYVEQGRYATHLKNWLQVFPEQQILVLLMEDIKSAPEETVQKLYKFVGIDADYEPQTLEKTYNRSFANRHQGLTAIKDSIYMATRKPPFSWAWLLADKLGLQKLYRQVNQVESEAVIPEPLPETRQQLKQAFVSEIEELESLLQRPLDAWKQ
jgi:hypothetical protein